MKNIPNMMQKKFFKYTNLTLLAFCFFLTACSSNTDGKNDDVDSLSIADFAGVWDFTVETDQSVDEKYIEIKEDGSYILYDYRGDSFSNGLSCYFSLGLDLVNQGNGQFSYDGDPQNHFQISLSTNQLIITREDQTEFGTETNLLSSDFVPLCTTEDVVVEVPEYDGGPIGGGSSNEVNW